MSNLSALAICEAAQKAVINPEYVIDKEKNTALIRDLSSYFNPYFITFITYTSYEMRTMSFKVGDVEFVIIDSSEIDDFHKEYRGNPAGYHGRLMPIFNMYPDKVVIISLMKHKMDSKSIKDFYDLVNILAGANNVPMTKDAITCALVEYGAWMYSRKFSKSKDVVYNDLTAMIDNIICTRLSFYKGEGRRRVLGSANAVNIAEKLIEDALCWGPAISSMKLNGCMARFIMTNSQIS